MTTNEFTEKLEQFDISMEHDTLGGYVIYANYKDYKWNIGGLMDMPGESFKLYTSWRLDLSPFAYQKVCGDRYKVYSKEDLDCFSEEFLLDCILTRSKFMVWYTQNEKRLEYLKKRDNEMANDLKITLHTTASNKVKFGVSLTLENENIEMANDYDSFIEAFEATKKVIENVYNNKSKK